MNKFTKVAFKFLDLIVIFVMTFGSPMSAMAQDTGPSLTTNQADYAPGDSALIIGAGFTAGDYVLKVSGPSSPADLTVTADESGGFVSAPLALDFAGEYAVSAYAVGDESLVIASVTFTVTAPATPTEPPAATEPPTAEPTQEPTVEPPTQEPTAEPTVEPTVVPTQEPTVVPTPVLVPFIQSDKADYAPGELVTLTGGNWQGDTQVRIFGNDDAGANLVT